MTIEERIAWQRERMLERERKARPAVVASDPAPPRPRKAIESEFIAAFIADRDYGDRETRVPGRTDRDGKPVQEVKTLDDVYNVIAMEQHEEYMSVRNAKPSGKPFRMVSMEDIEYTPPRTDDGSNDRDAVMYSGEELRTEQKTDPVRDGTVHRVVAEVEQHDIRPNPTPIRPFAPPVSRQPVAMEPMGAMQPVQMANMQARMLDAIRSQRRGNIETMDE